MPTGYTADVKDGTVTNFTTFALGCARAMGALMSMRDAPMKAPIPERFEPETRYYDERLPAARARLDELRAMGPLAVREAAQQAYAADLKADDDYRARKDADRQRYLAMMAKVEAWQPPTEDHLGFKEFMTEQLKTSIDFDCPPGGLFKPPAKLEPEAWHASEIKEAERQVATLKADRAKEIERTESRNRWLAELRKSLAMCGQ